MLNTGYFSPTFTEARHRFKTAAEKARAELFSYPVEAEESEQLTIDVAILGSNPEGALVISSGLHGVEGFFGSAVQLALLEKVGKGLRHQFHDRDYRYVAAEFGTYGPIRVLEALRTENRAHFYCSPESPTYRNAKAELFECFCPRDSGWRNRVIESSLRIVTQGIDTLTG